MKVLYIYTCNYIFDLEYMGLKLLTSLYPLQVWIISLTSFKEFRMFWTSSFFDPLVKGTDIFWKVCGIIDGFNESRRKIASGVEKRQMSRRVPCNFVPPLREIYLTTPIS